MSDSQNSPEVKFGEELKRRLSILQSEEDFEQKQAEQSEKYAEQVETKPSQRNMSIFKPLQRYMPSSLNVIDDGKSRKGSRVPSYLLIAIATSLFTGLLVGGLMKLRSDPYTEREVFYIQLPGDLFDRSIEILLIPYIISTVISNVGKLPALVFLKLTSKIIIYSILSSLSASALGIIISFAFPEFPSKSKQPLQRSNIALSFVESFLDIFLNILPNNIVYACLTTEHISIDMNRNISGVIKGSYEIETIHRTNYLGIVTFCVFIGMALRQLGKPAEWFFCLTDVLNNLMSLITTWLIWASPVGIFFTIIGEMVRREQEWEELSTKVAAFTGFYCLSVIIHSVFILSLVLYVITFTNPFRYIYNVLFGLLTGFATCKSYSALPFMLTCLQQNHINIRLANAMMPLMATFNKNGNAILSSLLASYLIRQTDLGMNFVKALEILFFSTVSNRDIALNVRVFYNILILARHIGIDEDVAKREIEKILFLGWLLDRVKVCANLLGHVIGIKIIERISSSELNILKTEEEVDCDSLHFSVQKNSQIESQ